MDKNAIKKYAVWARRELISRVSQKALQYGISEKEKPDYNAVSINGRLLSDTELKQRKNLIHRIAEIGYQQTMEEAAYTWFNRFSALRFMEVNGYLPTHVRVFTDEQNAFKPQILAEAIHLEMGGLNMEKVYELKDQNKTDELYKYLLITQCNALSAILPGMFTRIADYTELLFPDNLLRESSVIEQMISMIPEDDWKDAVQIIGWLYQYYNAEPKDKVFDNLKKNIKISKENIPAATQLFTPDWIVRYMVENSLGRLWVEGHPNNELKANWKYYLEEAEQEPEVQAQLSEIRKEYAALKPEEIKVIDPCMGSGHILVYMFDVLVQIYEAYGYNAREAAGLILQNNLYGLDIDDRAAQLAYFAVMMKARQYDRRIFSRGIQPHVYAIPESNQIETIFMTVTPDMKRLLELFKDAKEYGSILDIPMLDYAAMRESLTGDGSESDTTFAHVIDAADTMAQKYHVVVTNPPYMGSSGMNLKLSDYVKNNYPDTKSDMSTVCMEKALKMCTSNGYMAMINIPVWMFLSSYEMLRQKLLSSNSIVNLIHLGRGVFGADFGTVSFVIRNSSIKQYLSLFRKLYERQGSVDDNDKKQAMFLSNFGIYSNKQDRFWNVPGYCIAYSASENLLRAFEQGKRFDSFSEPKQGLATADNNRFLRLWYEVCNEQISFGCNTHEEAKSNGKRWFPYNKGGGYRKWYGNNEYVINWKNDGCELCNYPKSVIRSPQYYFKSCLSWCKVTISGFSMRFMPNGFLFDVAGCSLFVPEDKMSYTLGFANSNVNALILSIISPTVNYEVGHVASLPLLESETYKCDVEELVSNSVKFTKADWDSFETSWDFKRHPMIAVIPKNRMLFDDISNIDLTECYMCWESECMERFNELKTTEEELNRIFIDIYGLQDELKPEVDEKDVTVRKADLGRDIRSLISYAVGCMFGRYNLGYDGLAYAGGEWDASKYTLFPADKDNIIPICDDDYFDDDITGRFIKWIKTVYGANSLESNLRFIADALGGKGTPREVIRNYFLNDFYSDHLKIYQKRPIYWLFDSGKKNGFKALIYMHRYQPDTIARIRTDYVHEQQSRYRTAIADLEQRVNSASTGERVKLSKQLQKLQDQAEEIRVYEEKIHHLADMMIPIDLDDGVKVNYAKFEEVLAKIK